MITSKYWNTNGIGIAVVVMKGYANDLACYIGASVPGAQTREIAEDEASRSGNKLSRDEAIAMIPGLDDYMNEHELSYRL